MIIPHELLSIIGRRRFIAEVRTESARQGLATIDALARGGISVFEISLAIPGAEELLRHYSGNPAIFVGAGGILDARQAHEAGRAGAAFIVAPIVAPELIPICAQYQIACILSALTPTEIIAAQRAGADLVNVFPISSVGGSNYLRSLFRHFTALNLMVSGGIGLDNVGEFLQLPVRALGISSALTPYEVIMRGDWNMLTHLARQFILATQGDDASASQHVPSALPPHAPILDTMRSPTYATPLSDHPDFGYPAIPIVPPPGSPNPMRPQTGASQPPYSPVPAAGISQPGQPLSAYAPGTAQPGQPLSAYAPGTAQPGQPLSAYAPPPSNIPGYQSSSPIVDPPTPPSGEPSAQSETFKPWDSKPAGEDWIN